MNKTEERATKLIDTPKCLLLEVPEGMLFKLGYANILTIWDGDQYMDDILLPEKYSYGQPILASEMREYQARDVLPIVEHHDGYYGYPDYEETRAWYLKALESFASLLRSHNLKPETTVVIPKTI